MEDLTAEGIGEYSEITDDHRFEQLSESLRVRDQTVGGASNGGNGQ